MTPGEPRPDPHDAQLPERLDESLAEAVEDYHRRQALGLPVDPAEYAASLGPRHAELLAILEAERALDEVTAPSEGPGLPRAFGPYTLVRELGKGGVGVVYEAVERSLGRTLALKILRAGLSEDPEVQERFRREARTCAALRHDNIVAIHASGEIDGQAFYAMDRVEGESLDALIKRGAVPEQHVLARELAKVAEALHALHVLPVKDGKGVIHRDVKPSNLMVRPDGRIVLTDFGLARADGSLKLTRSGQIVATPLFASAEQLLSKHDKVDARTDVYGLGASLYAALTGRPPFQTGDWQELYRMVLKERPPAPRSLAPAVDPDLERIVLKAIEKEPDDRYASAAEMAAQLRNFAEGRAVAGGPVSAARHALRAVGRRWKPIAAAAVVLAGAVVGARAWWEGRDGTLSLRFIHASAGASGTVWIDGREVGPMPWSGRLAPGRHVGEVRLSGEEPVALSDGDPGATPRFTIRPGVEREIMVYGMPEGGKDALGDMLEGTHPELSSKPGQHRGGFSGAEAVYVLAPRGSLRPGDLDEWLIEVGDGYVAGGRLVLRRGGDELWSEPLVWKDDAPTLVCGRFPADVLARVKPGDALQFGWVPPTAPMGRGALFEPVRLLPDDPAAAKLVELERSFAVGPRRLRELVRARALSAHGLHTAALREVLGTLRGPTPSKLGYEELARALAMAGFEGRFLDDVRRHVAGTTPAPALCAAR
jgi:tRNA A-37 threonylcarbamoyl transferase component Bud32